MCYNVVKGLSPFGGTSRSQDLGVGLSPDFLCGERWGVFSGSRAIVRCILLLLFFVARLSCAMLTQFGR